MPELPEVETVRRGLQPVMENAQIDAIDLRRPDLRFPFPENLAERLEGRQIIALGRRAKYLLIHLDTASALLCHLGMSGSFRVSYDDEEEEPGIFHHPRSKSEKHDHAVFHLSMANGRKAQVVYNDPRRFGFMLLHEDGALDSHPLLSDLGVEPTGNALDGALLAKMLHGKRAPLKSALMDQRVVAGLGNIYVCETLWLARLSPRRMASTISGRNGSETIRSRRLAEAIRAVIADAIRAGGSSLRDYVRADGSLGYFQHAFNVYDREGEACARPECGGTVRRIVQSGRSTFYCPTCQR